MKKTVPVLIWRVVFGLLAAGMINVGHAALTAPVSSSPITKNPAAGASQDDVGNASGSATSPTAPTRPPSGSGGLNTALPPPPQDLPPPPPKEDKTLEPNELIVVSGTMAEAQALAQQAQALGLGVKRRTHLGGLGFVVTVFRVPKELGVGNALISLRQALPNVWADANHRYVLQGDDVLHYGHRLIGLDKPSPFCGGGARIGMVDTAVDTRHPMLKGRAIVTQSFVTTGVPAAAPDHGTATAALLVGNTQPTGFHGLAPGARLLVASVFRSSGDRHDTTAEWVTLALDWLIVQKVQVINLSLGGPRNLLLEVAIKRILEKDIAIVAAAGNNGPEAPPVYPAAQQGVFAVTAVDAELKPYRKANRGDYIGFAAPGVDIWTAAPGKGGIFVSGTSYAVPFVTAAVVTARQDKRNTRIAALAKALQVRARDLGDKGRDPVFGWGLVQAPGCAHPGEKNR
ncbi:MAG: S8 family serine peptidase [Nitrospirota bacterium]